MAKRHEAESFVVFKKGIATAPGNWHFHSELVWLGMTRYDCFILFVLHAQPAQSGLWIVDVAWRVLSAESASIIAWLRERNHYGLWNHFYFDACFYFNVRAFAVHFQHWYHSSSDAKYPEHLLASQSSAKKPNLIFHNPCVCQVLPRQELESTSRTL